MLLVAVLLLGGFGWIFFRKKSSNTSRNVLSLQAEQKNSETKNSVRENAADGKPNKSEEEKNIEQDNVQKASNTSNISAEQEFSDDFSTDGIFSDGGDMNASKIPNWWLNSGGYFYVQDGVGKTIQGELTLDDKWRLKYRDYNASETDDGFHPQNIFRLVTKSKWKNFQQECYYKINKYILSDARERNESNGLLLFNRYQDGLDLYYAGIRVDGLAVIKKKIKGNYYTMTKKTFYPGVYDKKNNPNLLPIGSWIGIRSEVSDNPNGSVSIKLYIDKNKSGNWILAATAVDNGKSFGGAVIKNEGYAGIRTDFMDIELDDYKIKKTSKLSL